VAAESHAVSSGAAVLCHPGVKDEDARGDRFTFLSQAE